MVGFQTKLTYREQVRVFRTIPGLSNARFERLGSIHRNTFINSPALLDELQRSRTNPRLFFAGQITGVEGYVESMASGIMAGLSAVALARDATPQPPPSTTMTGALLRSLSRPVKVFVPVNAQFGLLTASSEGSRRADRDAIAQKALRDMESYLAEWG